MTKKTKIRSICDRENIKVADLEEAIIGDFYNRYIFGDDSALAVVASLAPKTGRPAVIEYLAKNPGSTYDDIPVKNAKIYLGEMLANGKVRVSGLRRPIGPGRPKNEYTLK